jgi:hypothetical protein
MRIIVTKEEREAGSKVKEAILTILEAEGVNASEQNPVNDYNKGISVFRDTQDNTVIDIKTDFITDIFNTFKKVGVLFIKAAIPFAKAFTNIGKLLEELDDRWTETPAPAPEPERNERMATRQVAANQVPTDIRSRSERKRPIGFHTEEVK